MPSKTDPRQRAEALWNTAKGKADGGEREALAALRKLVEHLEKHELSVQFLGANETPGQPQESVIDQAQAFVQDPKVRAAATAVSDLLGDLLRKRSGSR